MKTRLAAAVGAENAALLHAAFVDDVCALTRGTAARRVLAVAGEVDHPALRAIAEREGMERVAQGEGDLGARMSAAIERGLGDGAERVAIVGSDSPVLPPHMVVNAFALLRAAEVVLGPAEDGGYWIVGARRAVPWLFEGIAWGTAGVLEASERRLRERGAVYGLVERFWDVDEPADLERLRGALAEEPDAAPASRAALAQIGAASD